MLKKILSMLLIGLVMNLATVTAFAETKKEKDLADKLKSEITKLGTGVDAKIQVKLKDGTMVKGYVSEINDNEFVVIDAKTGQSTPIPYPQAKQVKGNNLSNGAKIAIGVGIIIGLTVILIIAGRS